MLKFIQPFSKISKEDVSSTGGKGSSLGEMTRAGLPVPDGFVVLASAFDRFLEETDINVEIDARLEKIDKKDINSVDRASNEIRDLIGDAKTPADLKKEIETAFKKLRAKYVAVRSSATAEDSSVASWAGELESYLYTPAKDLAKAVKKCWASLFTPRAIFYRFERKLHKLHISVAVVIQKMVPSEVAGVVFTVHPVTKDKDQLLIEAGWGLGESIVLGKITPDAYVYEKNKKIIMDINLAHQEKMIIKGVKGNTQEVPVKKSRQDKQKLTGREIKALAELCHKIEKHYQQPMDIEWAYVKNKFYIVQARPITTLGKLKVKNYK